MKKRDANERFNEKIERQPDNGCWLWTGALDKDGYGKFKVCSYVQVRANRWAFEREFGPLAPGYHACHTCDVRRCVRPDHLFAGTQGDNNRDAFAKGRHPGITWLKYGKL